MSLILCYCEKCGQHYDECDDEIDSLKYVTCIGCDEVGYFKPVPQKYLNKGKWGVEKNLEDEFVENIVKASPNFDQECWDRRVAFKEVQEHNDELLANDRIKQANAPKCPTCQSTNIEKISIGKKAVGGALFGLFSSDIRNTMHCKNCGTKW